jgi:hypothetical protein
MKKITTEEVIALLLAIIVGALIYSVIEILFL